MTSQPPLHTWVSDAIRMLQSISYVVSENEKSALCIVLVTSPPHRPISDSLRYPSFPLLLFLLLQHLESPDSVNVMIYVLICLFLTAEL